MGWHCIIVLRCAIINKKSAYRQGGDLLEIKVNDIMPTVKTEPSAQPVQNDENFKFTLVSKISETELQEKLSGMMADIVTQGNKIKKHMDVRDMKQYRALIKSFMNEIVNRSHAFSRENFLDRRGRHRVYGIVRLVDENLDKLAEQLIADEKDAMGILATVDEIKGLIMDIFL